MSLNEEQLKKAMGMLFNTHAYEARCNRTGKTVSCIVMDNMPPGFKPVCNPNFNCTENCECNGGTGKSNLTLIRKLNIGL